jgi:transposase
MIQIVPQMRILVAVDSVDFRRGIDGLAALCAPVFNADPASGILFVFRSRSGRALRCLTYDGQGYWLAQKRLSSGRYQSWPRPDASTRAASLPLTPHQLHTLLWNGDPARSSTAPLWRPLKSLG